MYAIAYLQIMRPEILQNISNIVTLVGILLTALGGYGAYFFGNKADIEKDKLTLRDKDSLNFKIETLLDGNKSLIKDIEPFKEYAKRLYPNETDQRALDNFKNDLDNLKQEVKKEKETIRSLNSILTVTFSGDWDEKPYPDKLMSPINDYSFLRLWQSSQKGNKVEFFATEQYDFETISNTQAKFICRQNVKLGNYPIGYDFQELKKLTVIDFFVHFIMYDRIIGSKIRIDAIDIKFYLNDKIVGSFSEKTNFYSDVKIYNNDKSSGWAGVTYKMNYGSIYDDFKFE